MYFFSEKHCKYHLLRTFFPGHLAQTKMEYSRVRFCSSERESRSGETHRSNDKTFTQAKTR